MKSPALSSMFLCLLMVALVMSGCSFSASGPTDIPVSFTDTSVPATATKTLVPTNTPKPTITPRPTKTPNIAATERIAGFNSETQSYFDLGYLKTVDGTIEEYEDFSYEWAQLYWYNWLPLGQTVSDFYISAHVKWSSAYRNADASGCGFIFAIQDNGDHYATFLDRSSIIFLDADSARSYSADVGLTRGTGRVKFNNPADTPVEADFTLIVKDAYAYVLVDGEVIGEYTLAQSKILKGQVGLTLLSGTNKDYGTRCEMSDIRVWSPNN